MTKTATKLLMLMFVLGLSALAIAGSKSDSSNSLAAQVETHLAGVAPNTVIISVDESGKTATLRGSVSSQAEMDHITELVRGVSGVRVIGSDLRVHSDAASNIGSTGVRGTMETGRDAGMHSESGMAEIGATGATISSETTTTTTGTSLAAQIEQRFVDVSPSTVVVVVDEATKTAYVRGSVASQEDIDRVSSAIGGISGLRVVGTNLIASSGTMDHSGHLSTTTETTTLDTDTMSADDDTVTTTRTITTSDASLRAAVEAALKTEGIQGQSKIAVETENGVVTLTGSALSESHADRIVALAMSVPGVVRVEPNITLRDQKRRYQVKPSADRDKEGHQVGGPDSRVPEDRKGEVDTDVDVDNPNPDDDDDDDKQ